MKQRKNTFKRRTFKRRTFKRRTFKRRKTNTFKKGGATSILINVIKKKDENKALYLIKNNPNNVGFIDTDDGNTALIWACKNNMPNIALAIISTLSQTNKETNIHKKNNEGHDALYFASINKMNDVISVIPRIMPLDETRKNELGTMLIKPSRIADVLKSVCKDSKDNCIALGTYDTMIYTFFNNFSDLSLIDTPNTKRIGNPSINGFIWSLPFKKQDYTAYAILKCSMADSADNLYYEYFVGKNFINRYIKKFPCFVETYDSYKLSSDKWEKLSKQKTNISFNDGGLTKYTGGFKKSCNHSKRLSVLIQHFDSNRFESLHYVTEGHNIYNVQYEIPFMCYQIMFVLSTLGNTYTHYDLHAKNVFCYKPYNGNKYIEMNYHLRDGTIVSFPTEYIMKIIDYGRNYFNNGTTNTNTILTTKICINPKCQPVCGEDQGYSIIQGHAHDPTVEFYDTYPNKPNQSHDLRFINECLFEYFKQSWNIIINYNEPFGTPEKLESGLTENPKKINNIHDVKTFVESKSVNLNKKLLLNKYDATWKKMAIMNIYQDGRDYEFITL
jgi:hypothetical protein